MTFKESSVSRSIDDQEYWAQARALDESPGAEARVPNVSCAATVAVATRLVARARHRSCAPMFERYSSLLGGHTADELERRVLFLSEADARVSREAQEISEGRAARERLLVEARELRNRVMVILEYHLGAVVAEEVDEIRQAKSQADLCRGTARLAELYRRYSPQFAKHDSHCDPSFPRRLDALAEGLMPDLGPQRADTRLRHLAWTRVADTYEVLRIAAMLFFREKPKVLAWYRPLRTAVLALAARPGRRGATS